jgi:hypothetical protein
MRTGVDEVMARLEAGADHELWKLVVKRADEQGVSNREALARLLPELDELVTDLDEEEEPTDEYDPGPEVDDQGGMSEFPRSYDDYVAEAAWY